MHIEDLVAIFLYMPFHKLHEALCLLAPETPCLLVYLLSSGIINLEPLSRIPQALHEPFWANGLLSIISTRS
jgi:hypothetical protein